MNATDRPREPSCLDLPATDEPLFDQPVDLWHVPWGTLSVLLAMGLLYVWVSLVGNWSDEATAYHLLASGAKVNEAIVGGQWYRLWSATFLHGRLAHLLMNGVGLLLVGQFLEPVVGHRRIWMLVMWCGATGYGVSLLTNPLPSVGASPAMYGLWGVLLVTALWRWEHLSSGWRALFWVFPGAIGLGVMGVSLVSSGVNLGLHLGGLGAGLLFGALALLPWRWVRQVGLFAGVMGLALGGYGMLHTVYRLVSPGVDVTQRLVRWQQPGVPSYLVPEGWAPGTFVEGACEVGSLPPTGEPACFVDPYHAVLVVGRIGRMERSPVGAAAYDAEAADAGPVRYQQDVVYWREDTRRDLAFALLAFHVWAPRYGVLFAAVTADPVEARTP